MMDKSLRRVQLLNHLILNIERPPVTDYLDAVVKGDQDQIDSYIAECLAVKAKYPKPE